jgi:hypothetical protein
MRLLDQLLAKYLLSHLREHFGLSNHLLQLSQSRLIAQSAEPPYQPMAW